MTIELSERIRDVPDFPKPGILFKDITPLLADPAAFSQAVDLLAGRLAEHETQGIVAIESRGFLFGAPIAQRLSVPLQLVRKPGKLPYDKVGQSYSLEYGTDRVEIHVDAIRAGARYAIVDDLIATGGTAAATVELVKQQGGVVACCGFVIELVALGGRDKLAGAEVVSLLQF